MLGTTRSACFAAVLASAATACAGVIDNSLAHELALAAGNDRISTLVFMADRVDLAGMKQQFTQTRVPLAAQNYAVLSALQERAAISQQDLVSRLDQLVQRGGVAEYHPYWLANCVRVDATPAVIQELAARADVEMVYVNYPIELIGPVESSPAVPPQVAGGPEPGLVAIHAPEAWNLGYRGEGILVATLDSGVDANHPALASRWAGVADPRYAGHPEWAWWDGLGQNPNFPYDGIGHGTHTMGTVAGGAPGDSVGVAPAAHWIAASPNYNAGIQVFVSDSIEIYQWMVNPDGDIATHWDVPVVCGNSWGLADFHGYPDCDPLLWSYLDACEAAGCAIIFAAGNEGLDGLRRPADRAYTDFDTCAVAAVNANQVGWPIAGFSSRGPTLCTLFPPAIKPNISAPGVDVRSSTPNGGYGLNSGTSMACPHIAGVFALIRQACPDMPIDQIKLIMYQTAEDLGAAGKDNNYGWGMVDVFSAINTALSQCAAPCPGDLDGSGDIDQSDLGILLADFGCSGNCQGDVDGDGDTDQGDLGELLANFGQACD
jgi:subtilisin family serine protease